MPLLHCNDCHHEWEGRSKSKCDWCGAGGYILEEETELERWLYGLDDNAESLLYRKE